MTDTTALGISGLAVRRGRQLLFEGFDLELRPGDLATVVGPNGAGKTSLLRVVAGLSEPEAGELHWEGRRVTGQDPQFARERLYLGHLPGVKADLSIRENLVFLLQLEGGAAPSNACLERALAAVGLGGQAATPVRQLSAGQRRRAGLARLALTRSRLWLLDEPLTNLDAQGQSMVAEQLQARLGSGGVAVVASHAALPVTVPGRHLRIRLGR